MEKFLVVLGLINLVITVQGIGIPIKAVYPRDVNFYNFTNNESLIQGRIVNGELAGSNQFPYQVYVKGFRGSTVSVCGGSLISNEYILTAAHCVKGFESFEIGLGTNFLNTAPVKLTPKKVVEHAKFNAETLAYDIALIQLPVKIEFSENIKAIKLPSIAQSKEDFNNFQASISGFGRTYDGSQVSNVLNYVDLRVISNRECRYTFGKVITDSLLCAKGWGSNKKNACQGDSGGGLALTYQEEPVLIGVVSFVSVRGCAFGDPSGFTRVSSYLDWIKTNSGIQIK